MPPDPIPSSAAQLTGVVAHYDTRAPTYDGSSLHRALAEIVADVAGDPGGPVVDVATGTGLVLRAIDARWPGTRLVGVDVSPGMLAVARSALPQAEWVRADVSSLPVADGAATLVTCVTALHLLAERAAAFTVWHRVLRRGGRLVTATFREAGTPARPGPLQDLGFVRRHDDFRTPDQVAAVLGEHGFALERHVDWTHGDDALLICVLRRRRDGPFDVPR